jgi:protein-S-isoprenylcysteine O-methyltransferase Ste14
LKPLQLNLEGLNQTLRKTIPPVYFFSSLLLMIILSYFMPISHLIYLPLRIFGVILVLLGLAITACGAYCFHQADTPVKTFDKTTTLVTIGPYRYSRNPMYLGMIIILTGTWIALGTLSPLFVIPVFFYIIQEGFIKYEEKILEESFTDEYPDYREKVRRWM